MMTVIHFHVAVWVLDSLIKDHGVANLWNVQIGRYHVRSVSEQEGTIVPSISRLRAVGSTHARSFHSQAAKKGTMVTGVSEGVRIHPAGKLFAIQSSG
jgi:hypothetical protein